MHLRKIHLLPLTMSPGDVRLKVVFAKLPRHLVDTNLDITSVELALVEVQRILEDLLWCAGELQYFVFQ